MHATAPVPPGDGRGDVVGVGGAGRAEDLAEDAGAAGPGRLRSSSRTSTAAASDMTKPSRLASNGIETPDVDRAVMLRNPAMAVGVSVDSVPPASMASQRPHAISRAA